MTAERVATTNFRGGTASKAPSSASRRAAERLPEPLRGQSLTFIAMCGIAGYSLSASSSVDRTLAAQALLAGIAERGADAVGYAHCAPGRPIEVLKQRSGASALLEEIEIPASATQVLLHVRDYTKGHPRIEANNHLIRHGAVVGVHNGI